MSCSPKIKKKTLSYKFGAGCCIFWNTDILIWADVFCETQWDSLVQATWLSVKEAVCYRLLYCHKHRQMGTGCCIIWTTDSYTVYHISYCSDQWYNVSCSYVGVALYCVLLKMGMESTSDMLQFSIDKLGNVCTSRFDAVQIWYCGSLWYPFTNSAT